MFILQDTVTQQFKLGAGRYNGECTRPAVVYSCQLTYYKNEQPGAISRINTYYVL